MGTSSLGFLSYFSGVQLGADVWVRLMVGRLDTMRRHVAFLLQSCGLYDFATNRFVFQGKNISQKEVVDSAVTYRCDYLVVSHVVTAKRSILGGGVRWKCSTHGV